MGLVLEVIDVEHVVCWSSLSSGHCHSGFFVRLTAAFCATLHILIALMCSGMVPAGGLPLLFMIIDDK